MINPELKKLIDEIKTLKREVASLKAQNAAGQILYSSSVVPANYTHKHRRSSIIDLDDDADIDHDSLTNTHNLTTDIDHDALTNFEANEHIDWTSTASNFNTSGTLACGVATLTHESKTYNASGNATFLIESGTDNAQLHLKAPADEYNSILFSHPSAKWLIRLAAGDNDLHFYSYDATANVLSIDSVTGKINAFKGFGAIDVNFANGTTYKVKADGDAIFKLLTSGLTGNILHDGTGADDERIRLPYLTQVPGSVDNGSIWMEADGLHIYYNGAEKVVAGA